MKSSRRASLVFIFITVLLDVLGFGIIIPVLPKLVETLTGKGPSEGAQIFGLLLSSYALMQFLFSPVLGNLSDRYGRRPVLLTSLGFMVVDYVIMALAPSVGWLFAGRLLSGLTGANFTVASAYVADITPPEKRAKGFGMLGAAFGAGFILGPTAGGLLGVISPRAPFWAAAVLGLLNCAYGAFVLPESLDPANRRSFSWKTAAPVRGLSILTHVPWVLVMTFSIALTFLANEALPGTWVLYTTYRFHWTPLDNGLSLAMIGVCSGITQMWLTGILVPRIGERRAVIAGMLIAVFGFAGIAVAARGWILVAILPLFCVGGIAGPCVRSLLSKAYGVDEQGAVQGALTSLQSLMGIIGPLVATWVFGEFTGKSPLVVFPGASFLLSAVLSAFAAVLAYAALRRQKAADTVPAAAMVEPA